MWSGLGPPHFSLIIGGAWIPRCRPHRSIGAAPPIAKEEADATTAALKPPKRPRPLIAIVASTTATETTHYLMPYGSSGAPTPPT